MEFFVIVFIVLGICILSSLPKSGDDGADAPQSPSSPRPVGGRGAPRPKRRVVAPQSGGDAAYSEADARRFVAELKRRGAAPQPAANQKPAAPQPKPRAAAQPASAPAPFPPAEDFELQLARIKAESDAAVRKMRGALQNFPSAPQSDAQPVPAAPQPLGARPFFRDKGDLKRAFVASEILRPPLSLRK